jgi:hypothetical protein
MTLSFILLNFGAFLAIWRKITFMCCSSTQEDGSPSACLRGLARHFKTEPTETVALCFGYPKTPCRPAEGKLSTSVDEQHVSQILRYTGKKRPRPS